MAYARRTDTTHAPIRDALRKVWGDANVIDTSACPGFVDLVMFVRGRVLLGECKTSRNKAGTVTRSQYQKSQKALLETWGSDVVLVLTSPEQAVRAVQQALGLGERDRHAI
jgi:hypothetical protein